MSDSNDPQRPANQPGGDEQPTTALPEVDSQQHGTGADQQPTTALPEFDAQATRQFSQAADEFNQVQHPNPDQQPTTALPSFGGQQGGQSLGPQSTPAAPQAPQYQAAPAPQYQAQTAPGQPAQPGHPGQPAQPGHPGQPGQGAPYPQPGQPGGPQAPMNTLAIVAFISSFFISIAGIICGHISLSQIKKSGERGRGFALAGTIIGYVALVGTIVAVIVSFVMASLFVSNASDAFNDSLSQYEESLDSLDDLTPTVPGPSEGTTDDGSGEEGVTEEPVDPTSGDRSAEFCAAFTEMSEYGSDMTGSEVDPEALEGFRRLAEIESPNQDVYKRFYEFVQNPLDDSDAGTLFSDYVEAAFDDGMACSSY